ncbi:MAG: 16S rRNA (cytosine(1402)-N(4))-methyltransferase RsmH [Lachnospiraceae bacterium]|nr:16S rRNA (cytosine(1402)-N(4))-methyltransferase RsmH [Lachnospiraceae bacterium]
MDFSHIPVLLNETIELLSVKPSGIYLDGTAGGGGHSYEIAKRLTEGGKLFSTDRDGEAVRAAEERLAPFKDRAQVIRGNYADYRELIAPYGVEKLDGILLDLGVSSHQFDDPERGFSYRSDGPLDMRMDERDTLTAADILNGYPEKEIYRVLRDFGEEPFAKNIAKHICQRREEEPLRTTFQLVDIIKAAIPAKVREKGGHPAKRTFQALRIETNGELNALREALKTMIDDLNEGGRIAVISFHSLEDRMVKQAFRTAEDPCICPPDFPVCVCGRKPKGFQVTKKPVTASQEELERNPRAKSAKLRVFEKRSSEA